MPMRPEGDDREAPHEGSEGERARIPHADGVLRARRERGNLPVEAIGRIVTVRDVLTAAAVYLGGWGLAELWTRATKPTTCPKGHRDLYCLDGWRCRECERVSSVRRINRLKRGAA